MTVDDLLGGKRWSVVNIECLPLLATWPDGAVDHVITDPPYDEHTHTSAMTTNQDGPCMLPINFAALTDVGAHVGRWLTLARRWCLAFCTFEMIADYKTAASKSWIRTGVWHRPDGAPQFSGDRPAQACDALAIMHRPGRKRWNGGGLPAFWSFGIERAERVHPTQKPVALMMRLVEQFTDPGEVVLDPFCGSGTTGVACLALGRRFIGIERDARYHALACERLQAAAQGLTRSAMKAGQVALL